DCQWYLDEDWEAFAFRQKGQLQFAQLAGLAFLNAFWNGCVSVFVMLLFGLMPNAKPLDGWVWWGLLVFLIPFEAIGLAMLLAFFLGLLEPFRRTMWRFESNRIVSQTSWPMYRRTKYWEVTDAVRLELRRRNGTDDANQRNWTVAAKNETTFDLAIV